ncbi:MAG: S8 family serine peptidase [Caulobacteraceae bacterium]
MRAATSVLTLRLLAAVVAGAGVYGPFPHLLDAAYARDGGRDHDDDDDHSGHDGGDGGSDSSDHGGGDDGGSDGGGSDDSGSDGGSDSGGSDDSGSGSDGGGSDDSGSDDHDDDGGVDDHGGETDGGGSDDNAGGGDDSGGDNVHLTSGDSSQETAAASAAGGGGRNPIDLVTDERGRESVSNELVFIGDARETEAVRLLGLDIIDDRPLAALDAHVLLVRAGDEKAVESALAAIHAAAPQGSADLNAVYRLAGAAPAKPSGATRAGRGGPVVGILDTRIDVKAAGLGKTVIAARSFAPGVQEQANHGTAVAHLIGKAGGRVMAADVFAADRNGAPAASAAAMARAVDWLVANKVSVVNFSLTGPTNTAIANVISRAQGRGVIVVAAAGNGGPAAPPAYPAAQPGVVAVTAIDRGGNVYRYANQGPYISFSAWGVDVPGPDAKARLSGTSFASPQVAAMIARAHPVQDAQHSARTIDAMRRRARDLGRPGFDPVYGYGVLAP